MPSLSFSSSAIRSSPQVGLSCAISRINSRRFFGSCGRPRFRDFHLQNVRNAVRCQCLRLDNDQSFTPIKEPGEQDHEGACSSGRTSRLHPAFLKQSELFAKEQVLGDDGGAGGKEQADEQEQATFYRSLQDHLRPSERSDLFFAEDTRRNLGLVQTSGLCQPIDGRSSRTDGSICPREKPISSAPAAGRVQSGAKRAPAKV